mmetsp:Transcript_19219/g.45551  ORF Transcript_19219/g.45551 Transcript_19219/m.45551 type:complete len:305 (+) Transcript_19219:138-1052(+)
MRAKQCHLSLVFVLHLEEGGRGEEAQDEADRHRGLLEQEGERQDLRQRAAERSHEDGEAGRDEDGLLGDLALRLHLVDARGAGGGDAAVVQQEEAEAKAEGARRGGQVLGDDRHEGDEPEEHAVAEEQLLTRELHVLLRPRRQRDERLLLLLPVVADVHVLAHPVRDVRLVRAGHALPQPVLEHNVLGRLQPDEPLGLALVLRAQLPVRVGDLVVSRILRHADHAEGGHRLLRRTDRHLLLSAAAKAGQRHHVRRDDGHLAWLHAPEHGRGRVEGEAARRRREDQQQGATERGRLHHGCSLPRG